MSAKILDGKILAQNLKVALKQDVDALRKKYGAAPHLVVLMIGEDAGACAYANSQKKVAQEMGLDYELRSLPMDITAKKLFAIVEELNLDARVHGVMLHKPVPSQVDYSSVINSLNPLKDVEGLGLANAGKLILGGAKILPCTPASVMEHIKSTGVKLRGKEAVVVGRSEIVGKPVSLLLLEQSATVTVCHGGTSEAGQLEKHIGRADILVVAIGKANAIKGDWIKKGAIVVDVGINRVADKIVGDVEFETAKAKAGFITPVPGGVGPVTVVMLMRNAVEAFKSQAAKGKE